MLIFYNEKFLLNKEKKIMKNGPSHRLLAKTKIMCGYLHGTRCLNLLVFTPQKKVKI